MTAMRTTKPKNDLSPFQKSFIDSGEFNRLVHNEASLRHLVRQIILDFRNEVKRGGDIKNLGSVATRWQASLDNIEIGWRS